MTIWRDPGDPRDPDPQPPPDDEEDAPAPLQRPPFDRDPEAQRAPGAGQDDPNAQQPPMQADADDEAVGNDNIRAGRVGGVMGPPRQTMGQGQGG